MTSPPAHARCRLRAPLVLLLLAVGLHVAGRIAAVGMRAPVDSLTYALAAYRLYDAEPRADDLVADKPPGQAMLTGWVYRLWPGPPTRLQLVPIESFFMVAGYGVFAWLSRGLFGSTIAAVTTLLLVLAESSYNSLDPTTDGFNLGENYLLLPLMAAVWAHLAVARPARGGLLTGLSIGVALAIKQTALALLLALIAHRLIEAIRRRGGYGFGVWAGALVAGILIAWLPVLGWLGYHGWLTVHLTDLWLRSPGHLARMPIALPAMRCLVPLFPVGLWVTIGWAAGGGRSIPRTEYDRPVVPGALAFVVLWLLAEALILWSMTKPGTHYYQILVLPAVLLSGFAMSLFGRVLHALEPCRRALAWRWAAAVTAASVLVVAMPLCAAAASRMGNFDHDREIALFQHAIEHGVPGYGPFMPGREKP